MVLVLVAALVIGGGVAYLFFGSEQVSAQEVRDLALGAMENMDTVEMDMDLAMGMNMYGMSMEYTTQGDYIVDEANKRMEGTITIPMMENTELEVYLIENNFYMNMGPYFQSMSALIPDNVMLDNLLSWIKYETPSWRTPNQFRTQKELLERAQVERLQDEKINGESCYVLRIKPTDAYWDYLENEIQSGSLWNTTGDIPTSSTYNQENMVKSIENVKEAIENMSMKGWYSKDSEFPLKCKLEMDMKMENIMQMQGSPINMEMRMEMTINFSNYNKPVSIELPEEAENAISLSSFENRLSSYENMVPGAL